MTKIFKKLFVLVAVLALTLTLTGCGFASKAQKLEEQWDAEKALTLEEIKDKMGDPTLDFTAEALGLKSGAIVWVDGCANAEEYKALLEAEESAAALVVTVAANKVITVDFVEEYKGEAK